MNHLSHHFVARAIDPGAPPEYFVGNLLPDIVAMSGEGRVRSRRLVPEATAGPLGQGVLLHLATDRRFHGAPEFLAANAEVSERLRSVPFAAPPRRVFFLAHVFVELALDAVLLRRDTALADHLYRQFDATEPEALARQAEALLGRPLPQLPDTLRRFARRRYLFEYADDTGLAGALQRVSHAAGVPNFESAEDRALLAEAFAAYRPRAEEIGPALWAAPSPDVRS